MRMFDYHYIHPGSIFIPCPNTTPGGLRAQYLIPNLMLRCECLSIHSSLLSAQTTSPRDPANPAQTVLLPNENILSTAGISAKSSEEIFPCLTGFVTKLGPQISLFPVPIFGVNTHHGARHGIVEMVDTSDEDEPSLSFNSNDTVASSRCPPSSWRPPLGLAMISPECPPPRVSLVVDLLFLDGSEELDGVSGEWQCAHTIRVPRT
jgi:hypothetical protein